MNIKSINSKKKLNVYFSREGVRGRSQGGAGGERQRQGQKPGDRGPVTQRPLGLRERRESGRSPVRLTPQTAGQTEGQTGRWGPMEGGGVEGKRAKDTEIETKKDKWGKTASKREKEGGPGQKPTT